MESEYFEAYRSLVSEVTNGMERVKQARTIFSSDEFLSRMEASYKEALMILNGSAPEEECQSVRSSGSDPPDSSDYVRKVTQSNVSSGSPNKRKLSQQITVTSHNPYEMPGDEFSWRKYGQKYILNSKYPRSYYRCAHRSCKAKKRVHRSEDGIYDVTYAGKHTCLGTQPVNIPTNKDS